MVKYILHKTNSSHSYEICIHRQTAFLFYLQAVLAGSELGYFNAGYLCKEFKNETLFNCVEDFFNMYLMMHDNNINTDSYALLTVGEYYRSKKVNLTKAMQLYVQLYQTGDPQVRT